MGPASEGYPPLGSQCRTVISKSKNQPTAGEEELALVPALCCVALRLSAHHVTSMGFTFPIWKMGLHLVLKGVGEDEVKLQD